MDSWLERLMPDTAAKTTVEEGLKLYSIKKSMWRAVKYRAHNQDFSQILWAERFSRESLQVKRQWYIDQGLPDVYSQEYLNYPIDESSAYFKRDDFLPFTLDDYEEKLNYYSAVDFAISTREGSDFTVIATTGVASSGDLLVVDIRRGRWDSAEIIEQMFTVHTKYKPELFIVEQGAIQKSIGPFLQKEMMQRGKFINLYPLVPTKDKQSRARSLQARMRAGGIRYDKDKLWYPILEDEMARFPKDRHDDQVDALSWIGLTLDKFIEASTPQEDADEEYNNMINDSTEQQGRSRYTGY